MQTHLGDGGGSQFRGTWYQKRRQDPIEISHYLWSWKLNLFSKLWEK